MVAFNKNGMDAIVYIHTIVIKAVPAPHLQ